MYVPSTGQPPHLGYRNQIMTVSSQPTGSVWRMTVVAPLGSCFTPFLGATLRVSLVALTGSGWLSVFTSCPATRVVFFLRPLSGGQNSEPISCGHLRNRSSETRMVSANTEGPSREFGLADLVCSTLPMKSGFPLYGAVPSIQQPTLPCY